MFKSEDGNALFGLAVTEDYLYAIANDVGKLVKWEKATGNLVQLQKVRFGLSIGRQLTVPI